MVYSNVDIWHYGTAYRVRASFNLISPGAFTSKYLPLLLEFVASGLSFVTGQRQLCEIKQHSNVSPTISSKTKSCVSVIIFSICVTLTEMFSGKIDKLKQSVTGNCRFRQTHSRITVRSSQFCHFQLLLLHLHTILESTTFIAY